MDRENIRVFSVTRDEARVIRKSARLVPDIDVVKTLTHYYAVRTRLVEDCRVFRFNTNPRLSSFEDEVQSLPKLTEWNEGSQSVDDLRYIYGPKLAEAAMDCVSLTLDDGLLIPTYSEGSLIISQQTHTAHDLLQRYAAVN